MNNPEFERNVVGCFMRYPEQALMHELSEDAFSHQPYRYMFLAVKALLSRDEPVNPVTVARVLLVEGVLEVCGGPVEVATVADEVAGTTGLEFYVRNLRMLARLRKAANVLSELLQEVQGTPDTTEDGEELLASIPSRLDAALSGGPGEQDGPKPMSQVAHEALQDLKLRVDSKEMPGVNHGVPGLIELMPSLTPTDLITIAGRPGMGKTALAGQVLKAAAMAGQCTLMFSMEMSAQQLALRMIAAEVGVPLQRLRGGEVHGPEMPRIVSALANVGELPMWVDDTARLTASKIRARVLRLQNTLRRQDRKLGLIVVDYLQLMRGDDRRLERHQQISAISKELKALAKELVVPVVQLSQLNREVEKRSDKRPNNSDLKESGAIEEDSDVILFPFRPGYYTPGATDNAAEIIVSKQRNGPTGIGRCSWDPERMEFTSPW